MSVTRPVPQRFRASPPVPSLIARWGRASCGGDSLTPGCSLPPPSAPPPPCARPASAHFRYEAGRRLHVRGDGRFVFAPSGRSTDCRPGSKRQPGVAASETQTPRPGQLRLPAGNPSCCVWPPRWTQAPEVPPARGGFAGSAFPQRMKRPSQDPFTTGANRVTGSEKQSHQARRPAN